MDTPSASTKLPILDGSKVPSPSITSPLLEVPLEVLLQITSRLKTVDYCNLRLTCKHIEGQLLNAFTREFFTKRQFMLTAFSLQALIDISKSRFSPSLRRVIIALEGPRVPQLEMHYSLDHRNQMSMAFAEYSAFKDSNHDCVMLTEALSNLKNLEAAEIRDFNSRSRFRDGRHSEWCSYGSRTLRDTTGYGPERFSNYAHDGNSSPAHSFRTLLIALGRSKSRPTNFEVILRGIQLPDHVFLIPDYLPEVTAILCGLQTLFLDLSSSFASPKPVQLNNNTADSGESFYLRQFLAHTQNLKHLRLNFTAYQKEGAADRFLTWLSQPVPESSLSEKLTLPQYEVAPIVLSNLQQLDLGMLVVDPKLMLSVLRKFEKTLRTVSLHRVTFHVNKDAFKGKINCWATFFKKLAETNLELTAINLSFLNQQNHGHQLRQRQVFFKAKDSVEFNNIRKWAGTNMQSALRDLISEVGVKYCPGDSNSEQEPSNSEEDEEDDDDEEEEEEEEDDHDENEDDGNEDGNEDREADGEADGADGDGGNIPLPVVFNSPMLP